MNPDNYGSREACQRLMKAGIVMETEAVWEDGDYGWFLRLKENDDTEFNQYLIPAPSMAEVWRELQKHLNDKYFILKNMAWDAFYRPRNNTIDDLIDLLIGVRKEGT